MSDKNLSVEDILEEYANKTAGKTVSDDSFDLDAILNGTPKSTVSKKTEVIEDVLEVGDNSFVFDPSLLDEAVASTDAPKPRYPFEPDSPEQTAQEAMESLMPEAHEDLAESLDLRHGKETVQGTVEMEKALEKAEPQPQPQPEPAPEPVKEPEPEPAHEQAPKKSSSSEPEIHPITGKNADEMIMQDLLKLKSERGAPKPKRQNVDPVNRASIEDVDLGMEKKIIPNTEVGLDENVTEEERLAYLNAKRRERVKQFIEETEEEKKPEKNSVADFESFDQAQDMAKSISSLKSSLVVRLCALVITSLLSAYITIATDMGLTLISILTQATSYVFANVILGLVACFVSYTVISVGIKKLFTLKADSDSLAAISMIFSLISAVALLADSGVVEMRLANVYISVSIFGLLVNTIGKLLIVTRTERNFRYISGGYSKYAAMHIDDEEVASKFTKGALTDFPSLSTSRKTEFVTDFIKNSYSADLTDSFCKIYVPIATVISIIVGVITAFVYPIEITDTASRIYYALSCGAGTMALCSAMGMMLVTNIPLAKGSKKYLQSSAVMLGYSAVDKFSDTNSVLVDAVDLFPDGMVEIVNIKPVRKTPIEEGILYAASLCCQTESILRPAFYKTIKGKTEMLYPVESYIYEDGLGLSGWIENQRVLFGNRTLMESHSIEGLPTPEKEASYAKGDSIVYLSIGGVVAMIYVVRLKASLSVSRALRDLDKQGITVILRSVDSLLSITKLSELFSVKPTIFKLLPFRYHSDYDAQTSYVASMSSPMIYSGRFASLAMLLCGTKKLQRSAVVGVTIQALASILGVILAVIFAIVGSFGGTLTATVVLVYSLIWTLITAIVQSLSRT
ncbi:MAG: hypothetical protein LUC38_10055 [Oscillospiraceae bacterium]|nr:hypothetical protein [Oscillospiraceae bacterium]